MYYAVYRNVLCKHDCIFVRCLERMVDTVIGIKLFYYGHKCAEIVVDDLIYSDAFSNGKWVGVMNSFVVCQFDDDEYDVVNTDYGFEVNKVV